ncbi:thiol:disulfide interchange protein DsbA [Serratia fonticola]|jgi:thiol:disulfide interchange protein DsbA|uniref:Thiol:disulfide interchange protein DsbA n=1 Tax=Serratia fonticola TaxID=47917 RepID=A0A559T791_SERFO|nr:DsbA family protein [Serratia fonticola]TQI82000.1 thiol:disulfide interchange protein DsbA [Serratia fonticola]TQI95977.1 thiol:disulfide interchange protein DsbA [Serratia fonticola]TVZ70474.1 thiol:disulfide interchange protein DsbA [Serratia fonticola]
MFKKPLLLIAYTLVVILISSLITTAYFHYFVLNQNSDQQSLTAIGDSDVKNSPIKDDNAIVEIFSYGCHYCALNEENIAKLEARMPAGSKLIRLHINNEQMNGLASFSSLFATLTVMGIEPQHRESAYKAIIKDKIDLSNPKNRDNWLNENGIDLDAYAKASQTPQVQELLGYMTEVSKYYKISATPTFIVNKKWLALQDRDFPAFADQLLSLLQHDKPLEQ